MLKSRYRGGCSSDGREVKHPFRSHEHYQSEDCWKIYLAPVSENLNDEMKLHTMARHMIRLGMKPSNQDEISIGQAACIALHKSARTDSEFYLNATRRLKSIFMRMCNTLDSTPEDLPRPTEFPPDIAAFQAANPRWF